LDNGSPRTPQVTLTPANVALLVGAILGLVSMGVYLRTINDRMSDVLQIQRENRATLELIRSDIRDVKTQLDWLLRQSPPSARP
jgi:hypothetical protein